MLGRIRHFLSESRYKIRSYTLPGTPLEIGILGSGDVGRTLAIGLARHGHAVMLGTRDPASRRITEWKNRSGNTVRVGTFGETAAYAGLLFLAINWAGLRNAIHLAGERNFTGKIVIDTTNPIDFSDVSAPMLAVSCETSAGESIQNWLPDAYVVKAFNHIGASHMVDPDFPGGPPDMFICGNDVNAKARVRKLVESLGWNVADAGPIGMSRLLESLALLWIVHSINTGAREHAFKILEK